MKRSVYLESLNEAYCSGKISEEAYDQGLMNADIFCEEDDK